MLLHNIMLALTIMKMGSPGIGGATAAPWREGRSQMERSYAMGDKGGKKDKNKSQKQKIRRQEQKETKKQDKQHKNAPIFGSGTSG